MSPSKAAVWPKTHCPTILGPDSIRTTVRLARGRPKKVPADPKTLSPHTRWMTRVLKWQKEAKELQERQMQQETNETKLRDGETSIAVPSSPSGLPSLKA